MEEKGEVKREGVLTLLQQHLLLAVTGGSADEVRHALNQGGEAGGPGNALHCAVTQGSLAVVRLLLAAQPPARPDAMDPAGTSAVHRCCQLGRAAILEVLLAAGGDAALPARGCGWRPLHYAAKHAQGSFSQGSANFGEIEEDVQEGAGRRIAEALVDFGGQAALQPCALGQTALQVCARHDNDEVARVILGAAPEPRTIASALRVAASSDSRRVAALLVAEAGADIFAVVSAVPAVPAASAVPVVSAASAVSAVSAVSAGTDSHARAAASSPHRSPLDAARSHGHHRMARLLLSLDSLSTAAQAPASAS